MCIRDSLNVTPDVGLIELSSAEIAAGEYELTGLVTGTSYTCLLYTSASG